MYTHCRLSEQGKLWLWCLCEYLVAFIHSQCTEPNFASGLRMQAQRMNTEGAYAGMSDVFKRTFKSEGLRGFYKGLFPNLLKVVPSASITYMVYEAMKKSLELE